MQSYGSSAFKGTNLAEIAAFAKTNIPTHTQFVTLLFTGFVNNFYFHSMPQASNRFQLIIALFASALFVLLACKGYCYYEDGEDPFFTMLFKGEFTGGPQNIPNSLGAWTALSYLFTGLFQWQNNFDWYGAALLFSYCLLVVQLVFIAPVIYGYAKKTGPGWFVLLFLLTSAALFSEQFFLWQLTRVSLLLSGIVIFRIMLNIADKEITPANKRGSYLFNIACFTFAALIRPEPPALNLVVWLPIAGLGILHGVPLKKYVVLVLPIVIITGLSLVLNTSFNQTDRNYIEFRKYQFSLFDFQQPISSLNMANEKDSIIFEVCHKPFFADDKQINQAFFKRVGILPLDKTVSSIPYYFKNLASGPAKIILGLQKLMAYNPGLSLLYVLYLFAGIVFVFYQAPQNLLWYLLSQLFPIVLSLAITALMKMENRVMVPLLWCFLIQNLAWCATLAPDTFKTAGKNAYAHLFIAALILPLFCLDGSKVQGRWKSKKAELVAVTKLANDINSMPEKVIVVNENSLSKFYLRPFDVQQRFIQKKPIVIENFMLYFLPGYKQYMQSVCGSSNIDDIIKFLELNKQNVLMLGQPEKMELLKSYVSIIYGIDFRYEKIEAVSAPQTKAKGTPNRNNLYRII